jgi:hypothetical protein
LPFANLEQTWDHIAAKTKSEHNPFVGFFRGVRSQHETCGMSENLRAAAQQKNRPLVQVAA